MIKVENLHKKNRETKSITKLVENLHHKKFSANFML